MLRIVLAQCDFELAAPYKAPLVLLRSQQAACCSRLIEELTPRLAASLCAPVQGPLAAEMSPSLLASLIMGMEGTWRLKQAAGNTAVTCSWAPALPLAHRAQSH
jgi:hypothetical protein